MAVICSPNGGGDNQMNDLQSRPVPLSEKSPIMKNQLKIISPAEAALKPWPPDGPGKPCQCRKFLCGQGITIGGGKKCYIQPPRQKKFPPRPNLCLGTSPFSKDTIYRASYYPTPFQSITPFKPTNELCLSKAPFDGRTTHKMSYPGYIQEIRSPYHPCHHPFMGDGPMQDITTQKHDYVPMPIQPRTQHRPIPSLYLGKGPVENRTTNRLSYQPIIGHKPDKFIPKGELCMSRDKMEGNTIHKLSYRPLDPQPKESLPWVERKVFVPPDQKVENNTVYRMSYDPPGKIIDCEDTEGDDCMCKSGGCYCEYPGQCFGIPDPRPKMFPKAGI